METIRIFYDGGDGGGDGDDGYDPVGHGGPTDTGESFGDYGGGDPVGHGGPVSSVGAMSFGKAAGRGGSDDTGPGYGDVGVAGRDPSDFAIAKDEFAHGMGLSSTQMDIGFGLSGLALGLGNPMGIIEGVSAVGHYASGLFADENTDGFIDDGPFSGLSVDHSYDQYNASDTPDGGDVPVRLPSAPKRSGGGNFGSAYDSGGFGGLGEPSGGNSASSPDDESILGYSGAFLYPYLETRKHTLGVS